MQTFYIEESSKKIHFSSLDTANFSETQKSRISSEGRAFIDRRGS